MLPAWPVRPLGERGMGARPGSPGKLRLRPKQENPGHPGHRSPSGEGLRPCGQTAPCPPTMLIIVAKAPFGEVFWLGRRLISNAISLTPGSVQAAGTAPGNTEQVLTPGVTLPEQRREESLNSAVIGAVRKMGGGEPCRWRPL